MINMCWSLMSYKSLKLCDIYMGKYIHYIIMCAVLVKGIFIKRVGVGRVDYR